MVSVQRPVGLVYVWMDAAVVGRYLDVHDMGLYRTGNTLVSVVLGLFFAPLLPVTYSAFSPHQSNLPRILDPMKDIVRAIALISFPTAFFFVGVCTGGWPAQARPKLAWRWQRSGIHGHNARAFLAHWHEWRTLPGDRKPR